MHGLDVVNVTANIGEVVVGVGGKTQDGMRLSTSHTVRVWLQA